MKETYARFLDSIESPGLKRTAKAFTALEEYDFSNFAPQTIADLLIKAKPVSDRVVSQYLTIITKYAYFINRKDVVSAVHRFDRGVFWATYKSNSKKYISNADFETLCSRIQTEEEYNVLYYTCLVRSIYEGIYSDNLDVLIHLKREDINGNVVTLHTDEGETFDLEISEKLANDLIELSKVYIWEHSNRFGTLSRSPLEGEHVDSCFKMAARSSSDQKFARNRHQTAFRNIANKYIDYNIRPYDVYLSGIMHRIAINLRNEELDISEVFEKCSKNKRGFEIIQNELDRSKYKSTLQNFLITMRGRVDMFDMPNSPNKT